MTLAMSKQTRWMWLTALLLMTMEFILFDRMTSRHHAHFYPRWNDQIQYLTDAYTAYDEMQAHGLVAGLKLALTKDAAQGTLHDAAAVLVFWLAGAASRSAALSLNLLVFLAWQAALLFAVTQVSRSRILGWMGFGLVLCVAYPWSAGAGSAVDFRLDHAAMCLFGVSSCTALLSDGFRHRGWCLALGVAVGLTVLERFLCSVYFGAIFVAAVIWVLGGNQRWRRMGNLGIAGAIAAAMILPIFWVNRTGILGYYWVGHITGVESTARVRGYDVWQSVQFVLGNLGSIHLQAWFGWTVASLTGLLAVLFGFSPKKPAAGSPPGWLFSGLVFLLLPATILIFHRQKSEVVLGILVPGVVLLVLWLWQTLWKRIDFRPDRTGFRLLPLLPALGAVAAGGSYFTIQQLRSPHSPEFVQGAEKVNQLSDYIYHTVRTARLPTPSVSIDRIVDFMDGRILRVVCYERHQTWVTFGVHLPDSILAGDDATVFFKLKESDFVVLTDYSPDSGFWPYDQQMKRLYPELKDWCDEHLRLVENFRVFGRDMSLYQRTSLP